jgi:hypothetical protein
VTKNKAWHRFFGARLFDLPSTFFPVPIEKVAESQFSEELSNPLVVYSTHPDLFVNLFFETIK